MPYRLDIEGMRALAVLLVVIFHINETLIPGGFVGVDLFFVISGYVITQRIFKDGLNKPGAFFEFYRRRIRRITPVMLFVTIVTLIAGAFILLPSDLVDLSWSAIAASFSAANIYFTFFLDTSYFAKDSHYIPLLHLWSLGVEEQFYLIWPLFLFVLMKWPRAILPVLVIIMIISIAWGEYWLRTNNFKAAYYMLPSRVFQLCTGGFCLFLAQTSFLKNLSACALLLMGIIGTILVVASAFALTGQDPFPGLNAIPVTLGAALLILSGTKLNTLSRILSIKPLLFIGGISYSAYLWHWPILAYLRYSYVNIDLTVGVAVFILIIAISYLSKIWIEDPFRKSNSSFLSVLTKILIMPTAVLTTVCVLLIYNNANLSFLFGENYPGKVAKIAEETKPSGWFKRICQKELVTIELLNDPRCVIGADLQPKILFWGDSNAAQFVETLAAIGDKFGATFRNVSHSGCPPIFQNAGQYSAAWRYDNCEASTHLIKQAISEYDHIIIGGAFASYISPRKPFLEEFQKTLRYLTDMGKQVTVIGQIPRFYNYDRMCAAKALKLPINCEDKFLWAPHLADDANEKLATLIKGLPGVQFFDFNKYICAGGICSPYLNSKPIYFNDSHLSIEGSKIIGKMAASQDDYDTIFSTTNNKKTFGK